MAKRAVWASVRITVIASLFWLAACSSTTFFYNRLDTILPWYVDDYVDLDGSQEQQLDQTLESFLRWHRLQELPRYVQLLDEIDRSLDKPVTPRALGAIYGQAEIAWFRLEQESLDWLLELGETLSDQQVGEFLAHLQDRQEEYVEDYLTRSEREYREDMYDNFAENLEDYLGRLTPQQRERLQAGSASLERADSAWLQERAAWLERLGVLLQRQPGWQQRLREAIAQRGETTSPRYLEIYEHNLGVTIAAVADVLNERTEKQDRHLRAQLANLRDDLQTLIAQGNAVPGKAA